MSHPYTISELAKEFSVTTRTIRFYEEKALLNPERIGTTRRYKEQDRNNLEWILRAKRLGFSLQDIQQLMGCLHKDEADDAQLKQALSCIRSIKDRLQQQQQDMEQMLGDLTQAEQSLVGQA